MKIFTIGRKQLVWTGICLVSAVLFLVINFSSSGNLFVSASGRLLPIYRVRTETKKVALSFDAAWGNEDTQQLIDTLAKYHAKATFFLVGDWVTKYPESVKALSDAGHEIGNHSDDHPHFSKLSRGQIKDNILVCNQKIYMTIGKIPTVFRAPFGEYTNSLIETMPETGMLCIQWDVDSHDWMDISAGDIVSRVTKRVKPGSIVLFHNAAKNTPAALPEILDYLSKEGYEFVSVSDLIYRHGYNIDSRGEQFIN